MAKTPATPVRTPDSVLSTAQIGAAGELLVQVRLLKQGLDSARMTVDAGIDLVVYSEATGATTVQVKTVERPTPSGGRGKLSVGWGFPHDLAAGVLAVVRLDTEQIWLFDRTTARDLAQQHRANGSRLLYWYVDESVRRDPTGVPFVQSDMDAYLLEEAALDIFAT